MSNIDNKGEQHSRLRVTLVAYKRLECSCVIELPSSEAECASDMLPQLLSDVVDATAYEEDFEYWEDGESQTELAHPDDDEPVSFRAVRSNEGWLLRRVGD